MPSLPTAALAPRRVPARLAALLLGLASASCEALYGGFSADNQDNCVANPALCSAPNQTCNQSTKLCETGITLTAIAPVGGTNVGGTPVTISGDRFVAGMTVSFDGAPATAVTLNSAHELTAMTPPRPGRQGPVTVELTNPSGQRVQSDKLFRYYAEVTFQKQCFTGPTGPSNVIVTDLNRDGKKDMLILGTQLIRPYLSDGNGLTFQSTADLTFSTRTFNVSAADINDDGNIDITLPAITTTFSILTLLGNGDGTFQAPIATSAPREPNGLIVADLNGDRLPDAVSLQNMDLVVQPFNPKGSLGTAELTTYTNLSSTPASVVGLVDMDGDGLLDAFTLYPSAPQLSVLFRKVGGWTAPIVVDVAFQTTTALAGDYNQDGVIDILVAGMSGADKAVVLSGLGGRRFGTRTETALPAGFRVAAQGDFNGDGLPDLVALNNLVGTDNVYVYLGAGGNRFVALPPLTVDLTVSAAASGDWDGDGHQDLVTTSQFNRNVCVMRTSLK